MSVKQLIEGIEDGLVELPFGMDEAATLSVLRAAESGSSVAELVADLVAAGSPIGVALSKMPYVLAHDNDAYEGGSGDEGAAGRGEADADADADDDDDEDDDDEDDEDHDDEDEESCGDETYGGFLELRDTIARIEDKVDGVSTSLVSTFSISLTVGVASLLCVAAAVLGVWKDVRALQQQQQSMMMMQC